MSFYCNTGYNLLIAGYGSKHDFLHKFASENLPNYPVIAVNGFINGLTTKYILNKFCDFLKQSVSSGSSKMIEEKEKSSSKQIEAQLEYMKSMLDDEESDLKYNKVVFMVHSIDGKSLRNNEIQQILSIIAAMKRVLLYYVISLQRK